MRIHGIGLCLALAALGCDKGEKAADKAKEPAATATPDGGQKVAVRVTKDGFEPVEVKLVQGKPAVMEITRTVESECLNAVRMPWLAEPIPLPLNQPVTIPVDTSKAQTFRYSCWMNMVFGRVTIAAP